MPVRAGCSRVTAGIGLVAIARVMVDRAITGIEDQLQERMGMRIGRAGAHLHRKQEEEHETKDAEERGQPTSAAARKPWCD